MNDMDNDCQTLDARTAAALANICAVAAARFHDHAKALQDINRGRPDGPYEEMRQAFLQQKTQAEEFAAAFAAAESGLAAAAMSTASAKERADGIMRLVSDYGGARVSERPGTAQNLWYAIRKELQAGLMAGLEPEEPEQGFQGP